MLLRRDVVGGFAAVARFRRVELQREQRHAAAALLRPGLVPFVGEEVIHGGQQERAKAALLAVGVGHPIVLQQPREELLRQVLRILRRVIRAGARRRKADTSRSGTSRESASRARVVSLRPAASTTDQCVVTKTGRRGDMSPVEGVSGEFACEEVLT